MPAVDEADLVRQAHIDAVAFRGLVREGNMDQLMLEFIDEGKNYATHQMTDGAKWTVLHIAADAGQLEMIKYFLKKSKVKIDEKDAKGYQALMLGAMRNHKEVCETLLESKAEINAVDEAGETALMKAAAAGSADVVKLLLEKNADADKEDNATISALRKAACSGHADCVKALLPPASKPDERQLRHCLLFGRLNGHEAVEKLMKSVLEPEPESGEAVEDAEGAVAVVAK